MNQWTLRTLNCMSYREFCSLYHKDTHVSYLEEKWEKMRTNLAIFLMELDECNFKAFVDFANTKHERSK
jgi:hypothetical protein